MTRCAAAGSLPAESSTCQSTGTEAAAWRVIRALLTLKKEPRVARIATATPTARAAPVRRRGRRRTRPDTQLGALTGRLAAQVSVADRPALREAGCDGGVVGRQHQGRARRLQADEQGVH